jgi:hypothetical protein|tara:strand:+ start:596 stop:1180 length:585 start_codon:yes stop_codon:yes gene_type:complete
MRVDVQKKVRIIQKSMETIRKSDKTLHTISFPRLAQELNMPLEELTSFFINVEDLFLNEQKRVNKKMEKFLDDGIQNAKTANQAKELLESATLKLIELLPDYSDLVFSASFYLPKCIEERARAKKYYKQAFRKIIKKGWPGKIDTVLERQTDLVLLSVYGFYEYCAKVSKKEGIAIHKDFTNMINLHLQDRLFF